MKKVYLIVILLLLCKVSAFSQSTSGLNADTLSKQENENKSIVTKVVDWYMDHLNYYYYYIDDGRSSLFLFRRSCYSAGGLCGLCGMSFM